MDSNIPVTDDVVSQMTAAMSNGNGQTAEILLEEVGTCGWSQLAAQLKSNAGNWAGHNFEGLSITALPNGKETGTLFVSDTSGQSQFGLATTPPLDRCSQ